ncbi:DUF2812 domain-containing protein [Clostridium cellulovorans]|uniref:DUF2812 domain-containing protein n=1 Tax=Clostridium cellulovorans (strain ATCC 35296 / DSM 3052 / OCM 3 / 743B) TaxID=573061 RepID=D9ST87_CLOC7|nr:DUF2812 domain-containing protein [Clostridium cellulovorans]ADL50703.1 Protein of unknown function DUF2812 [Clostridium cellulovorans 743B]
MDNKYLIINGLAFSEESDMEKLKNYASKGWILEEIKYGFFYKLKKDKPQDIIYTLDYQSEANEEYFTIFKEAGWSPVVSIQNYMHIFSAKAGTNPIYSDSASEIDKYESMRNLTKKGTIVSLVIAIALIALLAVSLIAIRPMFLIILGLLIIDMFVFVFNFMPYIAYNSRIKEIKKYGKCKSAKVNNKISWKLYIFAGLMLCILGVLYLIYKKVFGIFYMALGIIYIALSVKYYKKYKKSL